MLHHQQDHKVLKVLRDQLVLLVQLAVQQVQRDHRVLLVHKVQQVRKDHQVHLVFQMLLDHKVHLVHQVRM